MAPLVVCPSCNRHLRRSEITCPFCDADVGDAMANAAPRPIPVERLGRTAIFAFAAANLGVAACGGVVETPAPVPVDGSVNTGGAAGAGGAGNGGFIAQPHYGAPPPPTGGFGNGGASTGGTTGSGGYVIVPPYGVPPPPSGGAPSTGGVNGSDGMGTPIYGAPPIPEKS